MSRFKIKFSYDGSNYKGYQKQPSAKTVQTEIEKVLKKITNTKKVDLVASGRTDAGVHALNQTAHFDLKEPMTELKLKTAMNSLLPADIYIKTVDKVNEKFHARYDVNYKEYIYKINIGEYNPIERNYIYQHNKRLDLVSIERGMKFLEGKKDFTSFTSLDKTEKDKDCTRNLLSTKLERKENLITLSFLGEGFLKYMVRNMVGLLLEIGEGKKKSEDIITILEQKDRTKAGVTATPEGLYLKDVYY